MEWKTRSLPRLVNALEDAQSDGQTTTQELTTQGSLPSEVTEPIQLGRFEIIKPLGRGGMGTVYEAMDPKTRDVVAIKTVTRANPEALYRFKQEFRSLVGLEHPNVVSLYELHIVENHLFFAMELIRGFDFIAWLCGPRISPDSPLRRPCRDYPRLIDALHQLASGVQAIHSMGILHRDIKPSNVMVSDEGRVVLLDFGLVRQYDIDVDLGMTDNGTVLGTPLYMSPEQALSKHLTPACDWYGVGELLYQALTGRPPFQCAGVLELLAAKRQETPSRPSSWVEDIPEQLEALCMELMAYDPQRRPSGDEVLHRVAALDIGGRGLDNDHLIGPASASAPFLGRELERQALQQAAEATRHDRPIIVLVDGFSGVGKSALVQRFLDQLDHEPDTVVLTGKCSELESIPYKALDSVMDRLCIYLRRLSGPHVVSSLLPRDPRAVARLFPVLLSLESIAAMPDRDASGLDPTLARRRAFGALRELLGRIADRQRLVIYIDDLQWSDLDSTILLDAILRELDAPPLLLIAAFRSGAERGDGPLARLVTNLTGDERVDVRRIHLGPMSRAEATDLALCMLGDRDNAHRPLAEEIAREAEGNPFFVGELVRYARHVAEEAEVPLADLDSSINLDAVIQHRLSSLPPSAQRLLEAIAVAGKCISQHIALRAGLGDTAVHRELSRLRSESLVRVHGPNGADTVEVYHSRIRQIAVDRMDPDRLAEVHLALGQALESSGEADAVTLSHHFRQAGEHRIATRHTLRAAELAETVLAFERAAELYTVALELQALPRIEVPQIEARLAGVLCNAGRLYDSAQAYLRASDGGQPHEQREWTRRAAEQLLSSGYSEEGQVVLQRVLESAGLSLPPSRKRAIASLLWQRATLKLHGLRYQLHKPGEDIAPRELERMDVAWTASRGLYLINGIAAADFHARHLRLALRCGEPGRLARALAIEAYMQAFIGADDKLARSQRLIEDAERLAEQADTPSVRGIVTEARGHMWMAVGHWSRAVECLDEATTIFREQCIGMAQELSNCEGHGALCLWFMGQVRKVAALAPRLLRESTNLANPYVQAYARGLLANVLMAEDKIGDADEMLSICRRDAPRHFEAHTLNNVLAVAALRRYEGDAGRAWAHCEEHYPTCRTLILLSSVLARAEFLLWRGSCALAGATVVAEPRPLVREAHRCATQLLATPSVSARAYGYLVRAGAMGLQGKHDAAVADLREAIALARSRSMGIHVATAQRRLAALVQGTEGEQILTESRDFMAREGVISPERFTDMVAPGFARQAPGRSP